MEPGQKKSDFPGKFPKISKFSGNFTQKFDFFQAHFRKISIFSGNFTKNFELPAKNWSFTVNCEQIILLLFKSHHFRTYFLYIISYNNISRPVHDPSCPKY